MVAVKHNIKETFERCRSKMKMKKKYTRKQIMESIKYWQKQLKRMNESSQDVTIEHALMDATLAKTTIKEFIQYCLKELISQANYTEKMSEKYDIDNNPKYKNLIDYANSVVESNKVIESVDVKGIIKDLIDVIFDQKNCIDSIKTQIDSKKAEDEIKRLNHVNDTYLEEIIKYLNQNEKAKNISNATLHAARPDYF